MTDTLVPGKCPHCRSGGDTVPLHIYRKEWGDAKCCFCGEYFHVLPLDPDPELEGWGTSRQT